MENQIITGASFKRGKSKQDYQTPTDFRVAVVNRFGHPDFDLAASATNYFAPSDTEYFGVGANSLIEDWKELHGLLWLNPPFADIEPWAHKCKMAGSAPNIFGGKHILFLVPASVGSNWFAQHVHNHAFVHFINPRIKFEGAKDPYPKDCILAEYGTGRVGYDVWRWKT